MLRPSSYCQELPVTTLNMEELLLQFKVMKTLGYHSLFDEGFRREMRNPFRKVLYYKLVLADEAMTARKNAETLKATADRIGFYSNPELADKIMKKEEESKLQDPTVSGQVIAEKQAQLDATIQGYIPPDAQQLAAIHKVLGKA